MAQTNNSDVPVTLPDGAVYPEITALSLISAIILLITSLYGLVMNSLYIWVLRFRMIQSVNTTWFFHLTIINLICSLHLPLMAAYLLRYPLWNFGNVTCKLNETLVNLYVYATSFFLAAISLDRFFLVYFPIWYRKHMNLHRASITCLTMWGATILFSSPYLVLCNVQQKDNITVCCSMLTISWNEGGLQKLDPTTIWGLFGFRFALSFVLPFGLLSICYSLIGLKIRTRRLAKSKKPYRLMIIVVASFLICWAPYHVRNGMIMELGKFRRYILQIVIVVIVSLTCVHYCFIPILYLFIVDSFNKEFKKSIRLLINSVFR
ncbi:putative G-protein coupled receptor 33 [Leptodactylus fuscus]